MCPDLGLNMMPTCFLRSAPGTLTHELADGAHDPCADATEQREDQCAAVTPVLGGCLAVHRNMRVRRQTDIAMFRNWC